MTDPAQLRVSVRYFALVREHLGRSEETLSLPVGSTVGDAFALITADQPRLAGMRRSLMLMVNGDYVREGHPLADGDEMALIPPVSGGESATSLFLVTAEPLDPRAVEDLVVDDGRGAIVTFTGTVRNTARGRNVIALDYEAYPSAAEKQLALVADEISSQWPGMRTAIHHRTGYLEPGVASVVIACASPHRSEAFAAAQYAIDRLKQVVPIWKKEHYEDGSTWIGSEADYQDEVRSER